MPNPIEIFVFVDALGWEIVQSHQFLAEMLPYRNRVRMQFGYSCTAVPTILTGVRPDVHGHLSFFLRAQGRSPFWFFRYLAPFLKPDSLWRRGRVRNWVSRLLKWWYGYTGYFQLYAMPFSHLPWFDYCEKQDLFAEGGLAPVENLRDMLTRRGLVHHISDWHLPEFDNLAKVTEAAARPDMQFIFGYAAGFDSLLHFHVGEEPAISEHLEKYRAAFERILEAARAAHSSVRLTVFSDHGMTRLTGTYDVLSALEKAGLTFGKDYLSCLDSTMGRFWYLRNDARERLHAALADAPAHWLSQEEMRQNGVLFEDHRFGEEFLLLDAGIQIVPSDMGIKPLPGMHGFDPDDRDSQAAILSNAPMDDAPVSDVADYFRLMRVRAQSLTTSS